MAQTNTKHEPNKANLDSQDDEVSRDSGNVISSHRIQTILKLHRSGITTETLYLHRLESVKRKSTK